MDTMAYSGAQFALSSVAKQKGPQSKKAPSSIGRELSEGWYGEKALVRTARKQGNQNHQVRWSKQPLVSL